MYDYPWFWRDINNYANFIPDVLLHDPSAYVPEIIGLAIISGFIWRFKLYRPERIKAFIGTGQLSYLIRHAEKAIA